MRTESRVASKWLNQQGIDSQYVAYMAGIDAGLSSEEAALATFSGKQAQLYGFTRVAVSTDLDGDFTALFSRPARRA